MTRFDLSDREGGLIQPLLPNTPRGVARVEDLRVLNVIFRVLRTGSPWRDLPERQGPPTTGLQPLQPMGQTRGPGAGRRGPRRGVAR